VLHRRFGSVLCLRHHRKHCVRRPVPLACSRPFRDRDRARARTRPKRRVKIPVRIAARVNPIAVSQSENRRLVYPIRDNNKYGERTSELSPARRQLQLSTGRQMALCTTFPPPQHSHNRLALGCFRLSSFPRRCCGSAVAFTVGRVESWITDRGCMDKCLPRLSLKPVISRLSTSRLFWNVLFF